MGEAMIQQNSDEHPNIRLCNACGTYQSKHKMHVCNNQIQWTV